MVTMAAVMLDTAAMEALEVAETYDPSQHTHDQMDDERSVTQVSHALGKPPVSCSPLEMHLEDRAEKPDSSVRVARAATL
jgi:hypothetical protein